MNSDYLPQNIDVYCDGGSRGNPGPAASAFSLFDEDGIMFYSQSSFLGISTNNVAEYRAVEMAVSWFIRQKDHIKSGSRVLFHLDSLLVVNQLNGVYKVKDPHLKEIYMEVNRTLHNLRVNMQIDFVYIPRSKNSIADGLVNETLDNSS